MQLKSERPPELDALMQRDLELAQQEGTHETVAALYLEAYHATIKGLLKEVRAAASGKRRSRRP